MAALQTRSGDTAWSIVYKALLVLHIMIREGEADITLKYLSNHLHFFDLNQIKQVGSADAKQLIRYAKYLGVKSKQYGVVGIDYVRDEQVNKKEGGRLRNLSIDKGLLREVESVEKQIAALVRCKFFESDINNDIVLTCFRMLVNDLLCLYQTLNEGVINILEHYFEMSRYDAERALVIYKEFVDLTKDVVNYLRIAKHLEYATKLHVPTIRHAPTALANSLEDYLNDGNFEINRKQYLAERGYKDKNPDAKREIPFNKPQESQKSQQSNGKQASISGYNPWASQLGLQPVNLDNHQPQQQQPLVPQQTSNPFLQPQFTQAQPNQVSQLPQQIPQQQQQQQFQPQTTGFQPIQQAQTFNFVGNNQQQFQPQQTGFQSNGLQQSFTTGIIPNNTGAFGNYNGTQIQQTPTGNPFLQQQQQQQQLQQQQQQQNFQPKELQSSKTGNNPFAIDYKSKVESENNQSTNHINTNLIPQKTSNPFSVQPSSNLNSTIHSGPLTSQVTGTNPFQKANYTSNRISTNQPSKPQQTFGGYENLPTNPVFPQTIEQQHTNQFQQKAYWDLQQQVAYNQQQNAFNQQQPQQQQQQNAFNQQPQQPQQSQNQFSFQQYDGPSLI